MSTSYKLSIFLLHALKPFWNYEALELTLIISLHVMFTLVMVEVTFAWMMTLCILVCIKYWGITFACGFSPPIKLGVGYNYRLAH